MTLSSVSILSYFVDYTEFSAVSIYLNYIGRFVVPEVVVELTEEEKLAEAKRQEKLEKKRASNRKYMARKREEARKAWAEIEAEKAKAVGQ